MAQYRPYDTQWLTRASFGPTAGRRIRKRLVLAVAVLVPLIVVAARSGYVDQRLSAPLRSGTFNTPQSWSLAWLTSVVLIWVPLALKK